MEDSFTIQALCAESIMAFKSFVNRFGELPLVLAGPILRQVTTDAVTVWVALKQSATVTPTVYDSDHNGICMPAIQNGCFTGTNEKTTYSRWPIR